MGLREDIKRTIEYAERFDCCLSVEEIKQRLISDKIYTDTEIENKVKSLNLSKNSPKNVIVAHKTGRAKKLAKEISGKFKDILFIGMTGSVAAGHPNTDDDIDLLIVTKGDRLWLNRIKIRWFIYWHNIPHRRYGKKENRDDFCFNFWLDENSLKIPSDRRNLRCAIDLLLMKPIVNKENIYERFVTENDWAKKWVATGYSKLKTGKVNTPKKTINLWWKLINLIMFWPQYWFMKNKIRSEKIGLGRAMFTTL